MITLCFLLPISIQEYGNHPSLSAPNDASQFKQLQVTGIELSFFAFAGVVLSLAGGLFAVGPARIVGAFGAIVGILAVALTWIQIGEVQSEIDV
jgi:hypothetical protein